MLLVKMSASARCIYFMLSSGVLQRKRFYNQTENEIFGFDRAKPSKWCFTFCNCECPVNREKICINNLLFTGKQGPLRL